MPIPNRNVQPRSQLSYYLIEFQTNLIIQFQYNGNIIQMHPTEERSSPLLSYRLRLCNYSYVRDKGRRPRQIIVMLIKASIEDVRPSRAIRRLGLIQTKVRSITRRFGKTWKCCWPASLMAISRTACSSALTHSTNSPR